MKEIIFNFFENIGHQMAVVLLMGTAVFTTGTAVSKLSSKPKTAEPAFENSEATPSASPTPEIIDKVVIEYVTVTPAATPTPTPTLTLPLTTTNKNSQINGQAIKSGNINSEKESIEREDDNDEDEREDEEHEDRYIEVKKDDEKD